MKKVIFLLLVMVGYILIINLIGGLFNLNFDAETETTKTGGGSILNINIDESVSVLVTRNRWYGVIYENNGKSVLYLFYFIKLPLKNNFNFLWFHIPFLIITLFWICILIIRKIYKYKYPHLFYEKVG